MKKLYKKPTFEALELEIENGFLAGSVTDVKVEVGEVTVQPFEDGFASEGGFKEISFD